MVCWVYTMDRSRGLIHGILGVHRGWIQRVYPWYAGSTPWMDPEGLSMVYWVYTMGGSRGFIHGMLGLHHGWIQRVYPWCAGSTPWMDSEGLSMVYWVYTMDGSRGFIYGMLGLHYGRNQKFYTIHCAVLVNVGLASQAGTTIEQHYFNGSCCLI